MDKLEEFRKFASQKPHLKDLVKEGKTSWQELFEHYDIYGEEDELFKEEEKKEYSSFSEKTTKEEPKKDSLNSIFDTISGFDPDKLSDGLNGMKKILGILQEVTRPEEPINLSRRKMARPYQRNDD